MRHYQLPSNQPGRLPIDLIAMSILALSLMLALLF